MAKIEIGFFVNKKHQGIRVTDSAVIGTPLCLTGEIGHQEAVPLRRNTVISNITEVYESPMSPVGTSILVTVKLATNRN